MGLERTTFCDGVLYFINEFLFTCKPGDEGVKLWDLTAFCFIKLLGKGTVGKEIETELDDTGTGFCSKFTPGFKSEPTKLFSNKQYLLHKKVNTSIKYFSLKSKELLLNKKPRGRKDILFALADAAPNLMIFFGSMILLGVKLRFFLTIVEALEEFPTFFC